MADEDTKTINPKNEDATSAASATADGSADDNSADESADNNSSPEYKARSAAIMSEVASRISEAHNILIALSSDPSVDELAAALGVSICLDRAGKRATAIYSGSTPDALEFLKPHETFEPSADALQDFVIAINKDKADHLRYKLDGDYVRIFITPYKSRISDEDLEFSYGDFNIDLVLALDVMNGTDLDAALREHGRIMHDAKVINITTGKPGKFGEIEWSDKNKSSVSEMVAELLLGMKKVPVEKDEATAFLTGIVAATNRFSNAATTSETMQLASKLMEAGADQQLIAENITGDTDNQMFSFTDDLAPTRHEEGVESLDINHDEEEETASPEEDHENSKDDAKEHEEGSAPVAPVSLTPSSEATPSMDPELQAVADSLASASDKALTPEPATPVSLSPSSDFSTPDTAPKDYGQMLEEALAEDAAATTPLATPMSSAPGISEATQPSESAMGSPILATPTDSASISNPAASIAPTVSPNPDINGIPEMNFNTPGEDLLPPPPVPPVEMNNNFPPLPNTSVSDSSTPNSAPVTPGISSSASPDASAFQIPTAPNL